jgi:hypothetical protein
MWGNELLVKYDSGLEFDELLDRTIHPERAISIPDAIYLPKGQCDTLRFQFQSMCATARKPCQEQSGWRGFCPEFSSHTCRAAPCAPSAGLKPNERLMQLPFDNTGSQSPDFSAKESGLGYLYQARHALWLLLDGPEERELVLEGLDDIVLGQDGAPLELLQTKHNSIPARLTDASPQLWKTLRIWSTHIKDGRVQVPPTTLTLITTAEAPVDSVTSSLRPGIGRDCTAALDKLKEIAGKSSNNDLKTAFAAFGALTQEQQLQLVEAVHILDSSPDISDIGVKIRDRIRAAVDRQNRDALYERLEGWWFGKVVDQLRSSGPMPIAGFEVYDKLRAIAEQFGPNALPIDYLDAKPDSINPHADNRIFVQQLRVIDVGIPRIEKAILDYYRAFEQRSRWAREELLVGDEVESYERRLIDEWERFAAAITDELPPTVSEIELKKVGRQIFNWMEQTADFRIRPNVTEPYVMRGSFHILANKPAPSVWWHPKFLERVSEILTEPAVTS